MNFGNLSKPVLVSLLAGAMLAVTGCSGNSEQRLMEDAGRFSAVTRTTPGFRPPSGAALMWYSELIVQDSEALVQATPEQVEAIQSTIDSQLISKGYRISGESADADYLVAAALIMDNSEASQGISELVSLYPGLANAFNNLEQGTLLVVISEPGDPQSATLLWRGAIQAYVVGDSLPMEQRIARVQSYAARLINALPTAGRPD